MIYQQILNKIVEIYNIDMSQLLKVTNEVYKNNRFSTPDLRQCSSIGLPVLSIVQRILNCDSKMAFFYIHDGNMSHSDFICILSCVVYGDVNKTE